MELKKTIIRMAAAAVLAAGLACGLAAPGLAEDVTAYAIPSEDGTHFKINYAALEAATSLTREEKFMVAAALRRDPGYVASGFEKIDGLKGRCKTKRKFGIPDGVECKLTADPVAATVLSGLGTSALSTALCLVINADDDEITEPFCSVVLDRALSEPINMLITECASRMQTLDMSFEFELIPPKVKPKVKCVS